MDSELKTSSLSAGKAALLLLPFAILLGLFFYGAVASLFVEIFAGGLGDGLSAFHRVLGDGLFQVIAWRTLRVSAVTTVVALVVGYGVAFAIWRSSPRVQIVMVALIMFPLLTSIVVRTYAWAVVLNRGGIVNTALLWLGLIDRPLAMMKTEFAVLVANVQILLPYTVLPIFSALSRIDERLLHASAVMGARPWHGFRRIVLPLSLPGIAVAGIFTFVISLGFFITPAILGGPRSFMLSNLIHTEVTTFLDLRSGAVMSLTLLAATLVLLVAAGSVLDLRKHLARQ